jgi:hypothetical protein
MATGYLRTLGMSLEEVGARVKRPRQRILEFEKAEAKDRITLQSLRRVARRRQQRGQHSTTRFIFALLVTSRTLCLLRF